MQMCPSSLPSVTERYIEENHNKRSLFTLRCRPVKTAVQDAEHDRKHPNDITNMLLIFCILMLRIFAAEGSTLILARVLCVSYPDLFAELYNKSLGV